MTFTFNFGEVIAIAKTSVGTDFGEPVPPGRYNATVTKAEVQETKNGSGNPLIYTELTINADQQNAGRIVFNRFVLMVSGDKMADNYKFFVRDMGVFGLTEEWLQSLGNSGLEPIAAALVGRGANVEVVHKDGYANIKRFRPLSAAPVVGGAVPVPGAPVPGVPVPGAPVPGTPTPPAVPVPGAVATPPPPPQAQAAPPPPPPQAGVPAAPPAPGTPPAPPPPPFAV